jgi:hypothetical protein
MKALRRLKWALAGAAFGLLVAMAMRIVSRERGFDDVTASGASNAGPTLSSRDQHDQSSLPVPRFREPQEDYSPQLSTGHPAYDPSRLALVIPARSIFAQEPRNSLWADKLEPALKKAVRSDLDRLAPGLDLNVECKSTTCMLSWPAREIAESTKIERLLTYLWGGPAGGKGPQPHSFVAIYKTSVGPMASVWSEDGNVLLERLERIRNDHLERLRRSSAAGRPMIAGLRGEELPPK